MSELMRSFEVDCPNCKTKINFMGDNWDDRLVDDSDSHDFTCPRCGKDYKIVVHATYLHEAKTEEDAEND